MATRSALPFDVRLMNWVASALFLGVALAALGSAALWAARHPSWTLGHIVIDGEVEHQNEVAFRAILAPQLRGSFLTLDLQEVKRLFESAPWVRQAVVKREFPNRLHVTLEEHEAAAWWGEAGSDTLVNFQGVVFEADPDEPQTATWPELLGPEGRSEQVYALYRQLQPVFQSLQHGISRLELDASGHWRATLTGGTVIELGRGDSTELLARARRFGATWPELIARYGGRDLESADLRYPNGYAVRMRGVQTVTDDKAAAALAARVRVRVRKK
ncbi:cell division protein FtsQ/DivIB [Malikia sp.]|uniref:cell division protein FtsQ/DivIB n=1 Tax=Malikia sp. TaxID=2070706 RepID=UPI0026350D33|nr:cell division protein FtsQ/DivIB [Malikia sp.]MDD2727820.1 cell division protein FtsQ/DivIB [Malikia sp.]